MSLDGVGFGEGEDKFPSIISLKLLFPTFLASCGRKNKKPASDHNNVDKQNSIRVFSETDEHMCLRCCFSDQILLPHVFQLLFHYF